MRRPRPSVLAGSREAAQLCACGHARLRHTEHGTARCTGLIKGKPTSVYGLPGYQRIPCTCPTFRHKEN